MKTKPTIGKTKPTIGACILTCQAKEHLYRCLKPLLSSPLAPKILVVDSSSTDGTDEIARRLNVDLITIKREDFNHGNTREFARKHLATDIVCYLTQDAELENHETLSSLVAPIVKKKASLAYARQVPHPSANFFEAFARSYNYPKLSHIRSISDIENYGVYTFFCSNSCAAYSNEALDEIGGFDEVLLGEDTVAAAKLLHKGHHIAYVAEAVAKHSHRYTLWEEFSRSFDTGFARKKVADLLRCSGKDSKRGKEYAMAMMREVFRTRPLLTPYALFHLASKWAGYQLGARSTRAPLSVKKLLSSQKFYWSSSAFLKKGR